MDIYSIKQKISEIKPTNRNPLYQSHLYWSQKPFNISDLLIEELTEEGDIVFDPFMGSGVTIFESVLLNRKSIGVEINELPIFIVNTLLRKVGDKETLNNLLTEFEDFVDGLNKYYKTWSAEKDDYGIVKKVIFDRESPFTEPVIKEIHYQHLDNRTNYIKEPDIFDIEQFSKNNGYKYINDYVMVPNSRLAVYNEQSVSSLFTPRALCIINDILEYEANLVDQNLKDIIRYILMSALHLIKITDLKSNSQWPLWTPKENCLEKNAVDVIKRRIRLFIGSYDFVDKNFKSTINQASDFNELSNNGDYYIINKGTQHLTNDDIPDNSIDLVITDPPYLGQVLYSEYMQLYYPFLNLKFNFEDEIVISNAQGRSKDEDSYFDLLDQSFEKITRKLKKRKIMCIYFHDSNLSVWNNLINITRKHGLHFLGQVHIYKKLTLKNILSPKKSLQGDSILFFINEKREYEVAEVETIDEIVENIVAHVKFEIKSKGSLTTTQLMDEGLMEYIIQNNWLSKLSAKYKSIIDVFEPFVKWDKENGKWVL
ncbi:DNA methyltransferase [Bacillus kwashiorkori]|uniref:DNA methyltransferase n=1 Tax=Bacillus kwashiorkori TaxID=1522318 RepID=UPI000786628A|nr:DNA methyltransferase [Bacillus kwashiorkori]